MEDDYSPIEAVGGDDGAGFIADALRVNTSLTELQYVSCKSPILP